MTDSIVNGQLLRTPLRRAVTDLADAIAERLGAGRPADDRSVRSAVTVVPTETSRGELEGLVGELASAQVTDFQPAILVFSSEHVHPDIESTLDEVGLHLHFRGFMPRDGKNRKAIAVVLPGPVPGVGRVPANFRVTAIMTVYNESDILAASLQSLRRQGVDVYVIDNWSTDDSHRIARDFLGRGVIGIEQYPVSGPTGTFDWTNLLTRVEAVAEGLEADWIIHHDVDEYRMSPWPGVPLCAALHAVQSFGFNAVDHTVLTHHPTADSFAAGDDFVDAFPYFEFGTRPGHFRQIKAWRQSAGSVRLADSGGHQAIFDDRRVFPFNFLLRHYPIRTQAQGERKVFHDRRVRWNPVERGRGWHSHYDSIAAGHNFISSPDNLLRFDDAHFFEDFLPERLLRVGLGA
jgi:glycosyltransferase involved in cell wall biosynthesis